VAIAGIVDARDGGAEDFPVARRFPRGLGVQRDVEFLSADQVGVRHRLRGVGSCRDAAVNDRQLIGRNTEARGRQLEEHLAGGRPGLGQVPFVEVGRVRLAARGGALIGCDRRVALHQPMRFTGTPSSSAITWICAVCIPWPSSHLPV
jgi:hypothetical protein